jgi:hypothetical protein
MFVCFTFVSSVIKLTNSKQLVLLYYKMLGFFFGQGALSHDQSGLFKSNFVVKTPLT